MSDKQDDSGPNSLGLDLQSLSINDQQEQEVEAEPAQEAKPSPEEGVEGEAPSAEHPPKGPSPEPKAEKDGKRPPKDKKTPYINPDRVKTGGTQREKLSEEELAERMARMREQNERIKQRREDVKKDEEEFRKTQEVERVKAAKAKKVQEHIDRTREQNARRKLDKIQNREWDSGKKSGQWKDNKVSENGNTNANKPPAAKIGIRGFMRGGGGGRGRDRGRGGAPSEHQDSQTQAEPTSPVPADSSSPTSPPASNAAVAETSSWS